MFHVIKPIEMNVRCGDDRVKKREREYIIAECIIVFTCKAFASAKASGVDEACICVAATR